MTPQQILDAARTNLFNATAARVSAEAFYASAVASQNQALIITAGAAVMSAIAAEVVALRAYGEAFGALLPGSG